MTKETSPIAKINRKLAALKARSHVRNSFRHIAGPPHFKLRDDEVIAIILGRNMEFYLHKLFEWHRELGVEKFVYVDNGSDDGSVELAASQSNTIVASTNADFRRYQRWMRLYATKLFATGGWRLVIDGDELFDYPCSAKFPIPSLLVELEKRSQTAVVAQMLDMIPEGGLSSIDNTSYTAAIASCSFYDTKDITIFDYHNPDFPLSYFFQQNSIRNHQIKIYTGGIRKRLFGEQCVLTKHPLFKPGPRTKVLPHPHISCGFNCADFTAVLQHFKFAGDFQQREVKLLCENRLAHSEAHLRQNVLSTNPKLTFKQESSRVYKGPEDLLDQGFLVASSDMKNVLGFPSDAPWCR